MTASADQTILSASSFVGSIGVNTHVGYAWDSYNNLALVEDNLKYLGVTKLRDGLTNIPSAQPVIDGLAADGYKFDLVVPTSLPAKGSAALQQYLTSVEHFAAAHPGSIVALEGLNEINIQAFSYKGSSTVEAAAQFQAAYFAAVNGNADLANIPVYNLSLGYNDQTD
jgi:trimeric autotransporter adhesin